MSGYPRPLHSPSPGGQPGSNRFGERKRNEDGRAFAAPFLFAHLFSMGFVLLTALLLVRILRERRPPASTMAWSLAIVLIAYLGIPLYLILGGRKTREVIRSKERIYEQFKPSDCPAGSEAGATVRVLRSAGVPAPPVREEETAGCS